VRRHISLGMLVLRRIAARKGIYVIVFVGAFTVWDLAVRFRVDYDDGDFTRIELDGRPATRLHLRDSYLFDWAVLSFLGVLVIAPVIPSMIRKGSIEALHALPFSRPGMLVGHATTGTVAYGLLMALSLLMVCVVQGAVSSYWNAGLLLVLLPVFVLAFCITCYLTLFGVLFGSTTMSVLVTWLYVFIIPGFLQYREKALYRIADSDIGRNLMDAAYYVFPQVADMHTEGVAIIFHQDFTIMPFVVSLTTSVPALMLAVVLFRRRSF